MNTTHQWSKAQIMAEAGRSSKAFLIKTIVGELKDFSPAHAAKYLDDHGSYTVLETAHEFTVIERAKLRPLPPELRNKPL